MRTKTFIFIYIFYIFLFALFATQHLHTANALLTALYFEDQSLKKVSYNSKYQKLLIILSHCYLIINYLSTLWIILILMIEIFFFLSEFWKNLYIKPKKVLNYILFLLTFYNVCGVYVFMLVGCSSEGSFLVF